MQILQQQQIVQYTSYLPINTHINIICNNKNPKGNPYIRMTKG